MVESDSPYISDGIGLSEISTIEEDGVTTYVNDYFDECYAGEEIKTVRFEATSTDYARFYELDWDESTGLPFCYHVLRKPFLDDVAQHTLTGAMMVMIKAFCEDDDPQNMGATLRFLFEVEEDRTMFAVKTGCLSIG